MKNTGTLRIQTFAARQSAPVEGVTVAVQGDGFTLHCITDATGSAADIPIEAPACALSLDEDNTTRPYAIVSLTAAKPGYRTVRIEGIQIFAGQVTLAQPQMLPDTEEGKDRVCFKPGNPARLETEIGISAEGRKPYYGDELAVTAPIEIVVRTYEDGSRGAEFLIGEVEPLTEESLAEEREETGKIKDEAGEIKEEAEKGAGKTEEQGHSE